MGPPYTPELDLIIAYTLRRHEIQASYKTGGEFGTGSVGEIRNLDSEIAKAWLARRDEIAKKMNPEAARWQEIAPGRLHKEKVIKHNVTAHLTLKEVLQ